MVIVITMTIIITVIITIINIIINIGIISIIGIGISIAIVITISTIRTIITIIIMHHEEKQTPQMISHARHRTHTCERKVIAGNAKIYARDSPGPCSGK